MPTTRRAPAPAAPAAAPAPIDATPEAAPLPADIDAILDELGGESAVISLWRKNAQGRPAYLGRIGSGEFSLDLVRSEHGGGTYEARVIGANERIRRTVTFAIDGAPRAAGAAPAAEAGRLDRVEQLLAQMVERVTAPAPPARDPFDIALKMAELMKPAVAAAPAPAAGLSLKEMLELVRETREEGVKQGKELAGATPEAGDNMAGVLGQMMPPLIALVNRDVSAREKRNELAARMVRPNPAPAAAPAPAPNAAPAAPADDMAQPADAPPAWLARVKPFAGYLAGWAQKQCDPETYAVFILDNMDAESVATVEAEAEADDFAERTGAQLAALSPKLAPYRVWLTQLCAAIQEQVTAPADGDDDAPNGAAE